MLEITSPRALDTLTPDVATLVRSHDGIHGVLVTAPGSNGFDIHARYFWPWSGPNEDPGTGATHVSRSLRVGAPGHDAVVSGVEPTGWVDLELADGG